jgi:pimeloyl-ACP methyl ester carboxylesterase
MEEVHAMSQQLPVTFGSATGSVEVAGFRITEATTPRTSRRDAWLKRAMDRDPRPDLARIRSPILVVMGANDVVFPPDSVIERVRNTLSRANRPAPDAIILPRTSHGMAVLQTVGGAPFRSVISDDFIGTLVDWVAQK